MSEVDENPTRQVLPGPNDPCRRCGHPYSEHREEGTGCSVEFGKLGRVPTVSLGNACLCEAFIFEPPSEPAPPPGPELLDGPAMYAEGLGYLRIARRTSNEFVESAALHRAAAHFAGATAAVMAELAIDSGTDDVAEARWRAALLGDELPEGAE